MLGDTGNKRVVCILLECILILFKLTQLGKFKSALIFRKLKYLIKHFILHKLNFNQDKLYYRSGTVNSNMVNSKFHLIRSYCEIFFYNFPNIPCLKCTINSNFHLIRSKTLPTNDFELTVPDLYKAFAHIYIFQD